MPVRSPATAPALGLLVAVTSAALTSGCAAARVDPPAGPEPVRADPVASAPSPAGAARAGDDARDETPPVLRRVLPPALGSPVGPGAVVDVRYAAEDEGSGVAEVELRYSHAARHDPLVLRGSGPRGTASTRVDGDLAPGPYDLRWVQVTDLAGNTTSYHRDGTVTGAIGLTLDRHRLDLGRADLDLELTPPPSGAQALPGDGAAVVTWSAADPAGTAPGNTGTGVTAYEVTTYRHGRREGAQQVPAGGPLRTTVRGLENGEPYQFAVRALHASDGADGPPYWTSAESPRSTPVEPRAGAPTPLAPDGGTAEVTRLSGPDRVATAVTVSRSGFTPGTAGGVVLAGADRPADALAAAPLAAAVDGPLLLTPRDTLEPAVRAEITRVLPRGGTVHVLGGPAALARGVTERLQGLGYVVTRYAGEDRYDTARLVAERGLDAPATVVLATGADLADALSASTAAAAAGGALLLTDGDALPTATREYLSARAGRVYALGGPAAAAAPDAIPLVGSDRYETAARAAEALVPTPGAVGVASAADPADALAGSAHLARRGGALVLTDPDRLPDATAAYVDGLPADVDRFVYGGRRAVGSDVAAGLHTR